MIKESSGWDDYWENKRAEAAIAFSAAWIPCVDADDKHKEIIRANMLAIAQADDLIKRLKGGQP